MAKLVKKAEAEGRESSKKEVDKARPWLARRQPWQFPRRRLFGGTTLAPRPGLRVQPQALSAAHRPHIFASITIY